MGGVDIRGGRRAPGEWARGIRCWCEAGPAPGEPSSGGSGITRSKSVGRSQTEARVILL